MSKKSKSGAYTAHLSKNRPALPHNKGAIALRLHVVVIRTPDKLTMYYIYVKYICQEIHF